MYCQDRYGYGTGYSGTDDAISAVRSGPWTCYPTTSYSESTSQTKIELMTYFTTKQAPYDQHYL